MRVAASGGDAAPVTHLLPGQGTHRWPQFLPDGHRFLFLAGYRRDVSGIYLGSVDGGPVTRVTDDTTAAVYAPPGGLIAWRQGGVVAIPFDEARGVPTGVPRTIVPGVGAITGIGRAAFAASMTGVLAFRPDWAQRRQLVWVDRHGVITSAIGGPDENALADPELAPDGQRVAVTRTVEGKSDVWVIDLHNGVAGRLTFDRTVDTMPVWSLDSQRVAFKSADNTQTLQGAIFDTAASGAGDKTPLVTGGDDVRPQAWSPDGRYFLYARSDPQTGADLWALPLFGERKPFPLVQTSFDEGAGQVSPDGRWLAYESNERGRVEIYVRPFPTGSGLWQLSAAGGTEPRWNPNGKELFYLAPDGRLMAVTLDVGARTALRPSAPLPLFLTHLASGAGISSATGLSKPQYAVARDGRFLMNVALNEATAPPITVILSWAEALKK